MVPPATVTVMLPVVPPLHDTLVDKALAEIAVAGWVIVIELETVVEPSLTVIA